MGLFNDIKNGGKKKEKERKIIFRIIFSIYKGCAFRVTQELNGL